jgi:hypothetical protein
LSASGSSKPSGHGRGNEGGRTGVSMRGNVGAETCAPGRRGMTRPGRY